MIGSKGEGRRGASQDVESVRFFCGTSRGGKTLDQGDGGGNPFASALIELLAREELTLHELSREIVELTARKSWDIQRAVVPAIDSLDEISILPKPYEESRVALVSVFADYSSSGGASSLPGAEHDAKRVADALDSAGFETMTVVSVKGDDFRSALGDFVACSASADFAILYTTGHGVEVDGIIYLLPGDYPINKGNHGLSDHALRLNDVYEQLRAKRANLLFYAGCRNNPFG